MTHGLGFVFHANHPDGTVCGFFGYSIRSKRRLIKDMESAGVINVHGAFRRQRLVREMAPKYAKFNKHNART